LWEIRPQPQRGDNVHTAIEIRRFEAEQGTRRLLTFHAVVRCDSCTGRGTRGVPDPGCDGCGGSGRKRSFSHLDVAHLLRIEACPICVGDACARCGGRGTISAERRIRLRVPPGVEDGAQLRVSGDGNAGGAGSIPGDLLVNVRVLPPPKDPRAVRYAAFMLLLVAVATLVAYLAH
jgi:molecular chaperone DnaJ